MATVVREHGHRRAHRFTSSTPSSIPSLSRGRWGVRQALAAGRAVGRRVVLLLLGYQHPHPLLARYRSVAERLPRGVLLLALRQKKKKVRGLEIVDDRVADSSRLLLRGCLVDQVTGEPLDLLELRELRDLGLLLLRSRLCLWHTTTARPACR